MISPKYTFKVGDIVSAYAPGYWRILEILDRSKKNKTGYVCDSPLITGVRINVLAGKDTKAIKQWDAAYSLPASIVSGERLKALRLQYEEAQKIHEKLKA